MNIKRISFFVVSMLFASLSYAQAVGGKTGILLVHYGTQNDDSRAVTIDKLNSRVVEKFADCTVLEAYAAPSVIKTLDKRGIHKLSISQALDSLKAVGCERLAVQSTMLLDGVMTDILDREVARHRKDFRSVSVARPLLYTVDDCRRLVSMIEKNIAKDKTLAADRSQVVLVGHGSDSPANAMYSQVDYLLKDEGKPLWHVGTIEGYPTIDCVERQLTKTKEKRVILVPLLYIAGNHQRQDIGGVWRNRLLAAGYTVSVVSRGLGEMTEIQDMIINNIEQLIKE